MFPRILKKLIPASLVDTYVMGEDIIPSDDFYVLLILIFTLGIIHKFLYHYVFLPLAYYAIPKPKVKRMSYSERPPTPPLPEDKNPIVEYENTIRKFAVACYRFLSYGFVFAVGIYALYQDNQLELTARGQGWFSRGMVSIFEDWPKHRLHYYIIEAQAQPVGTLLESSMTGIWTFLKSPFSTLWFSMPVESVISQVPAVEATITSSPLLLHYYVGCAFYLYSSITLLLRVDGTPAKDFVQMAIHHAVTVFLIFFSWYWKLARYGSIILILHDVSDPFMEIAKAFLYSGKQKIADACFGAFALVFVVTRCVIFPLYVVYPLWAYICTEEGAAKAAGVPLAGIGFASLLVLQLLHIIWSALIIKMVYLALTSGKVGDDIREE